MSHVIELMTTSGCHLCEQALALLQQLQRDGLDIDIVEVEISLSETLTDEYGIRIPVLRRSGVSEELGWPFDYDQARRYVTSTSSTGKPA